MNTNINSKQITINVALFLMTVFILYIGSMLFVPMFYGLFIAIILFPACKKLEHYGLSRSLSIATGLLVVSLLFGALLTVLALELNGFRSSLPQLQAKLQPLLQQWQDWLLVNFKVSASFQNEWIKSAFQQISNNMGNIFRSTLNTLFILILTPVFSALFLYNRKDFVLFLTTLFKDENNERVLPILNATIHSYFNFCKGMVQVYIIVGILNSIGLMALGIKHALLFGFLTAVMTIVPYIGIVISALLPISIAWITKDSIWYPLGVMAIFAFVQYLEANVIFPRVVASQIKVSTWATLVAIIVGSIIWGVAGMILLIPFISILKIVSDYVPEWWALNILLSRTEDIAIRQKADTEKIKDYTSQSKHPERKKNSAASTVQS